MKKRNKNHFALNIKNPAFFKDFRLLILFLAMIFFVFSFPHSRIEKKAFTGIDSQISLLREDDRKVLEDNFKQLLLWSSFGFTLFGDKPLSIELRPSLEKFWMVWERNKDNFILKDYFLTKFQWRNYFGVLIGNRQALKQTIQNNKATFDTVFGFVITENTIIQALENGSGEVFEKIFSHDALLGILLGYGNENSWNFYNNKSIENKSGSIKETGTAFYKPNLFWELWIKRTKVFLPQFEANLNSNETKKLKEKYKKQKKEIELLYKNNDVLNVTFNQLCTPNNKPQVAQESP